MLRSLRAVVCFPGVLKAEESTGHSTQSVFIILTFFWSTWFLLQTSSMPTYLYPTISSKGHIQIASWSLYRKRLLSCAASLCEFLGSIIFWWALFSNSEINLRWLYWWGRWLKLLTLVLSVSPPLKADPIHLKNRSEKLGVAQAA